MVEVSECFLVRFIIAPHTVCVDIVSMSDTLIGSVFCGLYLKLSFYGSAYFLEGK